MDLKRFSVLHLRKGNSMAKYQQGDVLFVEVDEHKWNIEINEHTNNDNKEDKQYKMTPIKELRANFYASTKYMNKSVTGGNKENLTVAFGEATGHSHKFNMINHDSKIAIMSFGHRETSVGQIPEFINIIGGPATIKHEEHAALTIPEGHYKVNIVREYDHMAGRARFVVD